MSAGTSTANNPYERVHDIYGPGVFVAWFIVAYSATIRLIWTDPPRGDSIPQDFITTLAYPTVVAGHLVVQVRRYPGARHDMWTTTDEMLVPYVEAIRASISVLIFALGVNGIWAWTLATFLLLNDKDKRQTKRLSLVAASSILTLFAFCFLPYTGSAGLARGISLFCGAVSVFIWAPLLPIISLGFSLAAVFMFITTMFPLVPRPRPRLSPKQRFWVLSQVLGALCGAYCFSYINWTTAELWGLVAPASGFALGDLGQAFALAVAGVNVGYVLVEVGSFWNRRRVGAGLSVRDCLVKVQRDMDRRMGLA